MSSESAPELRGCLREHIMICLDVVLDQLEPTTAPTLTPFPESLDVMGDGSLVMLPTLGHTAGSVSLLIRRRGRSPPLLVCDLTYGAELLERCQVPGVGDRSWTKIGQVQMYSHAAVCVVNAGHERLWRRRDRRCIHSSSSAWRPAETGSAGGA